MTHSLEQIAFTFDPTAPGAAEDALFIRQAVRHHVPHHSTVIPAEALEEAIVTSNQAVDASIVVFKASILQNICTLPKVSKRQDDPEASIAIPMPDVIAAQDEQDWREEVAREVKEAEQAVPFSAKAAAVAMVGLERLARYRQSSWSIEDRAIRKQAREIAKKYLGITHPVQALASYAVDGLCRILHGRR